MQAVESLGIMYSIYTGGKKNENLQWFAVKLDTQYYEISLGSKGWNSCHDEAYYHVSMHIDFC